MCLTADTKLCCCQLCGLLLLLISILSCIFTHFLDTPEVSYCGDVASTEWLNNWHPKRFCTIFTFHVRWQFCSIPGCQNVLCWSKYWIVKLQTIFSKRNYLLFYWQHCHTSSELFFLVNWFYGDCECYLCFSFSWQGHGLGSVTACSLVHSYQHFLEESDKMGSYPRWIVFMSRCLRNTNMCVCIYTLKAVIFYGVGCGNLIRTAGRRCLLRSEPPSASCSVYISVYR